MVLVEAAVGGGGRALRAQTTAAKETSLDCELSLFCAKIREEKVAEHESRASGETEKRDCNGFIQRL